jgi:hypothetical protein
MLYESAQSSGGKDVRWLRRVTQSQVPVWGIEKDAGLSHRAKASHAGGREKKCGARKWVLQQSVGIKLLPERSQGVMRRSRWSGCQIAGREFLVLKNNEQSFERAHGIYLYSSLVQKSPKLSGKEAFFFSVALNHG